VERRVSWIGLDWIGLGALKRARLGGDTDHDLVNVREVFFKR
jgi:hypothetical protein